MRKPSAKQIQKGIESFIRRMLDVTVHLVRIENGVPRSGGSGFIYEKDGRHILFSVLHSFQPTRTIPMMSALMGGTWKPAWWSATIRFCCRYRPLSS